MAHRIAACCLLLAGIDLVEMRLDTTMCLLRRERGFETWEQKTRSLPAYSDYRQRFAGLCWTRKFVSCSKPVLKSRNIDIWADRSALSVDDLFESQPEGTLFPFLTAVLISAGKLHSCSIQISVPNQPTTHPFSTREQTKYSFIQTLAILTFTSNSTAVQIVMPFSHKVSYCVLLKLPSTSSPQLGSRPGHRSN